MVKKSILQLYRTTSFLLSYEWLLIIYLINKCDQKTRHVKNQIIITYSDENLKQLGLWNYCLVFSNICSVLYLASSKSRLHYSIALNFSTVQLKQTSIKTVSAFFFIICRSLEIKQAFKTWFNDNSWLEIIPDFSKTPVK